MIARKSSGGSPATLTTLHQSFMTRGLTWDSVSFRCSIIAKTKTQSRLRVLMKPQAPHRRSRLTRLRVTVPSSAPWPKSQGLPRLRTCPYKSLIFRSLKRSIQPRIRLTTINPNSMNYRLYPNNAKIKRKSLGKRLKRQKLRRAFSTSSAYNN